MPLCVLIRLYLNILSSSTTSRTCWCLLPLFHRSPRCQRKKVVYTFSPFSLLNLLSFSLDFASNLSGVSPFPLCPCISQWWRRWWMRRQRRRRESRSMYAPTYRHGNGPWGVTRSWQPPWRPACRDPSRSTLICLCTRASTGTKLIRVSRYLSIVR